MSPATATTEEPNLSIAVTQLVKGVVYRDTHSAQWQAMLRLQTAVRDYVRVLGLDLVVDESEGYAYLRTRPEDTASDESRTAIPRLVPRAGPRARRRACR